MPDTRVFQLLCWFVGKNYVYSKICGTNITPFGWGSKEIPIGMGIYVPGKYT